MKEHIISLINDEKYVDAIEEVVKMLNEKKRPARIEWRMKLGKIIN